LQLVYFVEMILKRSFARRKAGDIGDKSKCNANYLLSYNIKIFAKGALLFMVTLSSQSNAFTSVPFGDRKLQRFRLRPSTIFRSKGDSGNQNYGPVFEQQTLSTVPQLLKDAIELLDNERPTEALDCLIRIYGLSANEGGGPDTPGLNRAFERALRTKINLTLKTDDGAIQDRFGLATLLIDQERHEEAGEQLRKIISYSRDSVLAERATAMLHRTNSAVCAWGGISDWITDGRKLLSLTRTSEKLPPVHPFEALKWLSFSLSDATSIAKKYALNRKNAVKHLISYQDTQECHSKIQDTDLTNVSMSEKETLFETFLKQTTIETSSDSTQSSKLKIKLGYISPDITGTHPLAFLMQDVFHRHDRSMFEVHIYSLSRFDGSSEVTAIRNGADFFHSIPPPYPVENILHRIKSDNLDVMIDLCGHAGTPTVMELMSCRLAPIQISYMGFPGSSGASSYIDYMITDRVVTPPDMAIIRKEYTEKLILMPHCYFVNSHKALNEETKSISDMSPKEYQNLRSENSLPKVGFVFCCHSRPDKIDPITFRVWLKALKTVREQHLKDPKTANAVLWLLKSNGIEMEKNLRQIAKNEFGLQADALIFAKIAPRSQHLQRLRLADIFLDTPAYNAHTVGCDALHAGVPMISLLIPDVTSRDFANEFDKVIQTEKMASRVGASLLNAAGLDTLIAPDLQSYEKIMIRCVLDKSWFEKIKTFLENYNTSCPLFDTERWVLNMELGLLKSIAEGANGSQDINIVDTTI